MIARFLSLTTFCSTCSSVAKIHHNFKYFVISKSLCFDEIPLWNVNKTYETNNKGWRVEWGSKQFRSSPSWFFLAASLRRLLELPPSLPQETVKITEPQEVRFLNVHGRWTKWYKEGYVRQGKRKHHMFSRERVSGNGELTQKLIIIGNTHCSYSWWKERGEEVLSESTSTKHRLHSQYQNHDEGLTAEPGIAATSRGATRGRGRARKKCCFFPLLASDPTNDTYWIKTSRKPVRKTDS